MNEIRRSGWLADIISPYDFISRNFNASNSYEKVHNHNISIYKKRSHKLKRKYGIQQREERANDHSFSFHDDRLIDNAY